MLHFRLSSALVLATACLLMASVALTERAVTCDGHGNIQRLSCDDGVISVQSALYGRADTQLCSEGRPPQQLANTGCSQEGTEDIIKQRCDGKTVCEFNTDDVSSSDPCEGIAKYVETNYTCLPAIQVVTCEHSYAHLHCDVGQVISVYGADYGRRDQTTCSYRRPTSQTENVYCYNPTRKVAEICNGRNSCAITASNSDFGDPCVGTFKYLEVAYRCDYDLQVSVLVDGSDLLDDEVAGGLSDGGWLWGFISLSPEDRLMEMPNIEQNSLQKRETNWGPRSDTILEGSPCKRNISLANISPISLAEGSFFRGMRWTILEILSTTVRMTSQANLLRHQIRLIEVVPIQGQNVLECRGRKEFDVMSFGKRFIHKLCVSSRVNEHRDLMRGRGHQKTMLHFRLSSALVLATACLLMASVALTERAVTCDGHGNIQRLSCDDGVISVQSALYGRADTQLCSEGRPPQQLANTGCSQEGTEDIIKQRCDGKTVCEFNPHDVSSSDPCEGIAKYVETNYTCLPAIQVVTCEHSYAHLHCDVGQVISVYGADYGRRDQTTCSYRRPASQTENVYCYNPTRKVAEICNGRNSCAITASNSDFGDPCVGTFKYLEVAYRCDCKYSCDWCLYTKKMLM
ncbi:uncharacterized protein LOC119771510 [Cyprinodon tularosa]|uniref:uncharacterized protein LOC119771510 n=1 Tax=Cyprinodon tularosa TaxID=77115 RepID=UPI0018E275C1|nr:uncharacterized protein LOC119771510 [Cyprinodon tularosa]